MATTPPLTMAQLKALLQGPKPTSKVYLITYDKHAGADYADLLAALKNAGAIQASESAYLLRSTDDPPALYKKLGSYFKNNETFFAVRIRSLNDCVGWLTKEVIDWLNKSLPTVPSA